MASSGNVFALFGALNRKCCLIAIGNSIRDVEYKERLTMAEIGAEIECSGETVENAKYERNLLEFDKIARLLARWPQHCAPIRNLWDMQPHEPETPAEKLNRLVRELAALGEEMTA